MAKTINNTTNKTAYLFTSLGLLFALFLLTITAFWSSSASANNSRIVAIDGSLTEIIYALGEGNNMVGRDITTVYPPAALKLPSVGYMRTLSAEGILSLKPNLVIATKDAKPRSVLDRLKEAGIRVELIDNEFTLAGVKEKIHQVAKVLNKEKEAKILIKKMQKSVDKATIIATNAKNKHGATKALYIMNMRGGNMMVAGKNSRANEMLELALVNNPAANQFKGYKPLTPEAAIKYNPQFIITMTHGLKAAGGKDAILKTPAISMTEAGKKKQLIVMENGFLTFGPRIGEAIEDLVAKIYSN
jgi:iron complex transport system substrate-binding protein